MSTGLLGPNGKPISSADFENKKLGPPKLGERYGQWAGEEYQIMRLPGGGAVAFDTSRLTLNDFRGMLPHYQINSSLSLLTFMMHQMDWHIECEDPKMRTFLTEEMQRVWNRLVRAKSQAFWAGFSPNVLQWENDVQGRRVRLDKIKDLVPEDARVKWKTIEGPAPGQGRPKPKFKVYDGISHFGQHIPVPNSYWYPLLMQNGNYYGKRLLESAFQPWFFSTLMHLFANRYYERFGEPVPVGRAPYEDEITVGNQTVKGNVLMEAILTNLRNRSVVILPNERTPMGGDETNPKYDYEIEYLESQMRGADFERYMTRLDEEMSLALFTPILMMRTADVGSYNLGTQHAITYDWMLNAISGDWKEYIDRYVIRPLNYYNSPRGERAPRATIHFTKLGKVKSELLQAVLTELQKQGKIKYDVRELGEMCGLTIEEVEEVTGESEGQEGPPDSEGGGDDEEAPVRPPSRSDNSALDPVVGSVKDRLQGQAAKGFRVGSFEAFSPGYKRQFRAALEKDGVTEAPGRTASFYGNLLMWLDSMTNLGPAEFRDDAQFIRLMNNYIDALVNRTLSI